MAKTKKREYTVVLTDAEAISMKDFAEDVTGNYNPYEDFKIVAKQVKAHIDAITILRGSVRKDEDVVSDEHIVEYDVSEIGNVLSEIRGIENAMGSLKKSIYLIDNSIKNIRMVLHKLESEQDLP